MFWAASEDGLVDTWGFCDNNHAEYGLMFTEEPWSRKITLPHDVGWHEVTFGERRVLLGEGHSEGTR